MIKNSVFKLVCSDGLDVKSIDLNMIGQLKKKKA